MHNCMVKASNTSEANYGLTRLFYVQINAVYRFYGYDLVIDDALAIVYAIIGHCKIWPHQICRLHCRVKRIRYPIFCVWIGAKKVCPPLRIGRLSSASANPHNRNQPISAAGWKDRHTIVRRRKNWYLNCLSSTQLHITCTEHELEWRQ